MKFSGSVDSGLVISGRRCPSGRPRPVHLISPLPSLSEMRTLLPRESTAALRRSFEAWSIFFQKPTK